MPGIGKTECNTRCIVCKVTQSYKKPGLKKGFLSCWYVGLKLIKGKWQAHLDKYLKLKLVEMVGIGWNPGLRKRQLD